VPFSDVTGTVGDDPRVTTGGHEGPAIKAVFGVPRGLADVFVERWRFSLGYRLFGVVCASVFVVIGGLLLSDPATPSDAASGGVMLVAGPVAVWLMFGRPYLVLTDCELLVQNALVGFVVPLASVVSASPSGWGVVLKVSGRNRPVIAMAVPEANWEAFLGRQGRAAKVADVIQAAARTSRGEDSPG